MKITNISIAALAAALILPATALADESIANLEMQTRADRQPVRTYANQTAHLRRSHKEGKEVRDGCSTASVAVYTEHRGLGEPQHFKVEHISTGNGGDVSFEVPAN